MTWGVVRSGLQSAEDERFISDTAREAISGPTVTQSSEKALPLSPLVIRTPRSTDER